MTNLDPESTRGHLGIISEQRDDFVYAHSTVGEATGGVRANADTGPDLVFHTQFPHPGRYKIWVQLNVGAHNIVATFVVGIP